MTYEEIVDGFNNIHAMVRDDKPEAAGLHVLDLAAKVLTTMMERQRIALVQQAEIIAQQKVIIEGQAAIAQSLSLIAGAVAVDQYGVSSLRTHASN